MPRRLARPWRARQDHRAQRRGVWLDRGELDKIIERNAAAEAPVAARPAREAAYRKDYDDDDDRHYGKYPRRHKRKSLLGELFDF
jgi:Zn-finger nucleic acid-binding protein